jgi:hypothetical protein
VLDGTSPNEVHVRNPGTPGFDGIRTAEHVGNSNRLMTTRHGPPATPPLNDSVTDPNALFIGNFYEGRNTGADEIIRFFNINAADEQGTPTPYYNLSPTPYGERLYPFQYGVLFDPDDDGTPVVNYKEPE